MRAGEIGVEFKGMAIEVETREKVTIIRPGERLDLLSYAELEEIFAEALAGGAEALVLDLHRVRYMNSSAIGVLQRYNEEAAAVGARLVVTRLSSEAAHIFKIVGLDRMLTVVADLDAALAQAAGA